MKLKVELSAEDVRNIVGEYLCGKFNNVQDLELIVDKEIRGHGVNETSVTVFKGAVAEVEI